MPILYDQFNRPIKKTKAPQSRPLAAAPLSDAWRDYVADGLTPERLAAILKQADGGDLKQQTELFEQLEEKDAHLPPDLPGFFFKDQQGSSFCECFLLAVQILF